jgi:hypothetical protein
MAEQPRILVEGGPVHRRVNHLLAAFAGFAIGALLALGFVGWKAIHAAQDARKAELARVALSLRNCRNLAGLAAIERAFIERQEAQTQALVKSGVRFGIPAARIPRLLKESRESEATFLAGLDSLALSNCSGFGRAALDLKGVVPGIKPPGLPGAGVEWASALVRPPTA